MLSSKFAGLALLILALITSAAGQGFRLYRGATKYNPPDTKEARLALQPLLPGTTITTYTTADSFEKVVEFYKGFAKDYKTPGAHGKLPNGQEIKKDIRDVTAIELTESK